MEGRAGEEEEFGLSALRNRESVELLEGGGDVVPGAGVSEEMAAEVWLIAVFVTVVTRVLHPIMLHSLSSVESS